MKWPAYFNDTPQDSAAGLPKVPPELERHPRLLWLVVAGRNLLREPSRRLGAFVLIK